MAANFIGLAFSFEILVTNPVLRVPVSRQGQEEAMAVSKTLLVSCSEELGGEPVAELEVSLNEGRQGLEVCSFYVLGCQTPG